MSRTVNDLKLQLTHRILLPIGPMLINRRRRFKLHSQRSPLRPRNPDPRRLLRQSEIHRFITFVQMNLRLRLQLLERRNAADVVEVRVCKRNALKRQFVALEYLDDAFRFVARVNTDRAFRSFATDDASVLLKRRDGYLFDYH